MDKNNLQKVTKLRDWIQKEFDVPHGKDLVVLAGLLADAILSTDITTLQNIFGRNQSNRLALRRLQSAFRLLKEANFLKFKD